MAERKDRIRVHIEGKEYSVVGGEFQEMLAAVKQINGRRFVGGLKVWQLPGTVEDIRYQLEISGYYLEGGAPVSSGEAPARRPEPAPAGADRIRLLVGPHRVAVVGGSFQEMLAAVKSLPGRRFDGESKMWEIPGDLAVVKGMIEAAGFELEGVENTGFEPVLPMELPDVGGPGSPPPFEPPDFFDDDEALPFEPPGWWDDMPPPSFEDQDEPAGEASPFEAGRTEPAAGSDQIRVRLGQTALIITGGSFQELLAAVKKIPGRRFNPEEKVWEIPEDISLDSVQQSLNAAGLVLMEEG